MLARKGFLGWQCSLLRTLKQENFVIRLWGEKLLTNLGNPDKLSSRLKIHYVLGTYINFEMCGWVK